MQPKLATRPTVGEIALILAAGTILAAMVVCVGFALTLTFGWW